MQNLKSQIIMIKQETIPVKMYGPIHKIIYNYEFLLPVVATAGIGAVNFGPTGLVAGALGGIDVVSNYFKIYDKPYLTSAFLGWGTLSSFKTQYYIADIIDAADIIGFTAGLLVPTGLIYPHIDKIIAPAQGAIYGYSYGGQYGAAMGCVAGIIDEGLSLYNFTSTYQLTKILNHVATANLFLPQTNRVLNYIIPDNFGMVKSLALKLTNFINKPEVKVDIYAIISGISLSLDESDIRTKSPAIQLNDDLYELYGKIIPKAQLDDLTQKQLITLIANNIIFAKFELTIGRYFSNFDKDFHNIDQVLESWQKFITSLSTIFRYLIPYVGSKIVTDKVKAYFQNKFEFILYDKLKSELLTGEVSLHLKQDRTKNAFLVQSDVLESKVLLDKMDKDISLIAQKSLVSDAISEVIKGSYAIGKLASINALDTILYTSFYSQLISIITLKLSSHYHIYDSMLSDLNSKINNKDEYIKLNSASMIIYNSNDFIKAGRVDLVNELRTITAEQNLWGLASESWSNATKIINYLLNHLVIANQIYQGIIDKDKRADALSMTQNFFYMVSWDAENAGSITEIKQSIERINELKARMEEINNPLEHQPSYHYEKNNQTGICLNDFKVGKGSESRLHIKDLCIFNKHVAVTSASGAGKSTFFKAIKQIIHGGVWSEGKITYFTKDGGDPNIAMTSQGVYIPPEDTLLELITFKKGSEAEHYRVRVTELLKKIKIDSVNEGMLSLTESLDLKEDWQAVLSGGQKQKIDAVRLMLADAKPDIIIFDEIFAGLDHNSIYDVQVMLGKEFPDTQIFVIDHEAKAHNGHCWYHEELHLSNGTAQLLGLKTCSNDFIVLENEV